MTRSTGMKALALLTALAATTASGCRRAGDDEVDQIGAAVGEMMSSLDESSQDGTATTALLPRLPVQKTPAELRGPLWRRALGWALPSAYAASCVATPFSPCDAGARTRTFADCSLGLATLDGSVALAFSSSPLCVLATTGQSVTRTADFTLTGLYGGTLTVTSPGGGQTLTRTATGFEYTVGGMERLLKGAGGRTLADVSTTTTEPVVITGSSRADLVIVSGALQVTHHLAGYSVTLRPDNLAWSAHCTCAVSGSLSGTVSGGKHDGKSASMTLQGCGEAEVTIAGETSPITLDRCAAI